MTNIIVNYRQKHTTVPFPHGKVSFVKSRKLLFPGEGENFSPQQKASETSAVEMEVEGSFEKDGSSIKRQIRHAVPAAVLIRCRHLLTEQLKDFIMHYRNASMPTEVLVEQDNFSVGYSWAENTNDPDSLFIYRSELGTCRLFAKGVEPLRNFNFAIRDLLSL